MRYKNLAPKRAMELISHVVSQQVAKFKRKYIIENVLLEEGEKQRWHPEHDRLFL